MKTSCEVVLEQRQKLFLSPATLQNMNILKISMLELETYIQKELQENPLLEESEYYHEVSEKNKDSTNDAIKEKDEHSERIDILLS